MSNNMDSDDKSYFSQMLSNLREDIRDIKNHLQKICDELHTVDNKVRGLQSDLKTHLETNEKKEKRRNSRHLSMREWILIGIAVSAFIYPYLDI